MPKCKKRKLFGMSQQCRTPSKVAHVIQTLSGGGADPRGVPTYDFVKISQKLHEIEKFLGRRGGTRRVRPPLNPPLGFFKES